MAVPLIGITADTDGPAFTLRREYVAAVNHAGGAAVILPCQPECAAAIIERMDGVILSGGDDPIMERWGAPTHPRAKPLHPDRQAFEIALLEAIEERPRLPVLGVCLGMQLMGLHAGGTLDQHLPDTLATAADHWGRRAHAVEGELGAGVVVSHHRQALTSAGRLRVVARAADGVIEAVRSDDRPFYLGVQWHPERTDDPALGRELIRRLVAAASSR
jgi:putative glutamine amidotransferase